MVSELEKKYEFKTKKQLIAELKALYKRIAKLEKPGNGIELTEDALLQRELVASAAIEEMTDSVMLVDVNGKLLYINKACEKLLGYKSEDLIGKSALELPTYRSWREQEKARRAMKEVMERGSTGYIDMGAITKSGKEIPVSFTAFVIKDTQGNPRNMVAIMRDITERKRAEEALKEREENFRALIENSLDISVITNADQTIRYVSPSVERVLGYKPHELIGKYAFDFLYPDDAQSILSNYDALANYPGQPVSLEVRFRHKDGSWRIIEGIANNLVDDPTVNGVVINARDITERKRAEEALKQREEHFRILIENSLDDVSILDRDGSIIYQSPSVERVLGYKSDEHIGRSALEFVHPDDLQHMSKSFIELLENPGSIYQGEVRAQHRDGSWRTLELMVRNFLDDPVVGGILANFRDITVRKMAEEERIKHAAALAKAEELQRSRQRMVTIQESVRREIAQQLHGSVQNRLIILLHRLMEMERTAPTEELANELGDLRQKLVELLESQVRSISHRLYPSILRRGLIAALQSLGDQFEAAMAVEMELDDELIRRERANPQLILEQVRLAAYRIAEEALTNAVKHAKASKVTIKLELSSEDWLRLTVQNDGQGFDLGSTPSGQGILMMQDYAEVVGGNCIVRSAPDTGTIVTAILPFSGPGVEPPERVLPSE
jgi:PAS domain S-box-containing protein